MKYTFVLRSNPIPLISSVSSSTNMECYCELAGIWWFFLISVRSIITSGACNTLLMKSMLITYL